MSQEQDWCALAAAFNVESLLVADEERKDLSALVQSGSLRFDRHTHRSLEMIVYWPTGLYSLPSADEHTGAGLLPHALSALHTAHCELGVANTRCTIRPTSVWPEVTQKGRSVGSALATEVRTLQDAAKRWRTVNDEVAERRPTSRDPTAEKELEP